MLHEKGLHPPTSSGMGGGTERAERDAARGWERRRTTGTALAVGLAVLGTLLVTRGHRWETDVAPNTADRAASSAADAGVGRCGRAINPVGGEENRHALVVTAAGELDTCRIK